MLLNGIVTTIEFGFFSFNRVSVLPSNTRFLSLIDQIMRIWSLRWWQTPKQQHRIVSYDQLRNRAVWIGQISDKGGKNIWSEISWHFFNRETWTVGWIFIELGNYKRMQATRPKNLKWLIVLSSRLMEWMTCNSWLASTLKYTQSPTS